MCLWCLKLLYQVTGIQLYDYNGVWMMYCSGIRRVGWCESVVWIKSSSLTALVLCSPVQICIVLWWWVCLFGYTSVPYWNRNPTGSPISSSSQNALLLRDSMTLSALVAVLSAQCCYTLTGIIQVFGVVIVLIISVDTIQKVLSNNVTSIIFENWLLNYW